LLQTPTTIDEVPSLAGNTEPTTEVPPPPPIVIDWTLSWYDIIGVSPGAAKRQIQSAWRQMTRRFHPDKGGDLLTFQRLAFIVEILTGSKRRQYDSHGRDHFTKEFPRPSPAPATGPPSSDTPMEADTRAFVYRLSPVNTEKCLQWANVLAFRRLRIGFLTYADILMAHVKMARAVEGRPGVWTCDRYTASRAATELKIPSGWETAPDKDGVDPRYAHLLEDASVDPMFFGLTIFAGPKILRNIARSGMGKKLLQLDFDNSFVAIIFQCLKLLDPDLTDEYLTQKYPEFAAYATDRSGVILSLMVDLNHTALECKNKGVELHAAYSTGALTPTRHGRCDIKKAMLSMTFGKRPEKIFIEKPTRTGAIPDFMLRYAAHMNEIASLFVKHCPAIYAKCLEWEKSMPAFSCMAYQVGSWQRSFVDDMRKSVPDEYICSEERDGYVQWCPNGYPREVVKCAAIPVSVDVYSDDITRMVHGSADPD